MPQVRSVDRLIADGGFKYTFKTAVGRRRIGFHIAFDGISRNGGDLKDIPVGKHDVIAVSRVR